MEDFENKIDKLASGGVDDDEHSWISTIYNEFNGNGAENDIDEDFNEIEGLEPPMLDETWGLKDSSSVDENATKPIPKKKLQDQEFAKFAEGKYSTIYSLFTFSSYSCLFTFFICLHLHIITK